MVSPMKTTPHAASSSRRRAPAPLLAILGVALAGTACAASNEDAPGAGGVASSPRLEPAAAGRLLADVAWLADDAREGRRAGTAAARAAGEWIAARFAELGLEPAGEDGYLQAFEVPLPVVDGGGSRVAAGGIELRAGDGLAPLFCSDGGAAEGPLVWRRYGIVDAERGLDDYASGPVDGKVVLLVRGAPRAAGAGDGDGGAGGDREAGDDTALVQRGTGWGNSTTLFTKVMNAKRRGAVAVLVAEHPSSDAGPMAFDTTRSAQAGIPALHLSAAAARRLVPDYDARVAGAEDPTSVLLFANRPAVASVGVAADVRRERGTATNVLARLPGRDPSRTVVVGAHYDHLGHGGEGSLAPDGQGEVHNGADDNASGTAVVLELARLLAAAEESPAGDVVFALWSGEELGLLGSESWARRPTVPLERVAANLNLDMVGRAGDGVLTVLGAGTAAPLADWIDAAGGTAGLELRVNRSGQGVGGSDHQTFLKRAIPAVHLFSGIHADYHRPSDDVERFEADGAARVTELARALVASLQSEPLEFVEVTHEEGEAQRVRGGFSVWFGSVPEYAYEGEGLLLAGTSAGSPAEKAGLLKDDVILRVGEVEVETIYDFMHALQIYKPGDVVRTRYRRDGVEEEVRVTLATRGEE